MKALIDGDILLYEMGSLTDDEGHPLKWALVLARLDGIIKKIVRESGSDSYEIFITGDGNFREKEATIKPYKGHRTSPKPHHYRNIKDYFRSTKNHKVTFVDGYEADDAMSMVAHEDWMRVLLLFEEYVKEDCPMDMIEFFKIHLDTVISSRDKDLKIRPGWHHEWGVGGKKGKGLFFVTPIEGLRWFFKQLLMGDSTDNIPGLFGVGKGSKLVSDLNKIDDPLEMYKKVRKHYEDRFGSYYRLFMFENARLLWMLRYEGDHVCDLLNEWEDRRKVEANEVDY